MSEMYQLILLEFSLKYLSVFLKVLAFSAGIEFLKKISVHIFICVYWKTIYNFVLIWASVKQKMEKFVVGIGYKIFFMSFTVFARWDHKDVLSP